MAEGNNKKKKLIKAAAALLFTAVFVVASVFWARYTMRLKAYHTEPVTEDTLLPIGIMSCDKLMIVAHPDDESIWGGGHLSEGGYLVVCITNGKNSERKQEFIDVVDKSGNTPLILGYPDKLFGERDNWDNVRDNIMADISFIMRYKDWKLIVTHNPDGEYGHIHHKMTSELTTKAYNRLKPAAKLYYFGKYYKAADIGSAEGLSPISDEQLAFKNELLKLYESQGKTVDKFRHMLPYEMWTEYGSTQGDI